MYLLLIPFLVVPTLAALTNFTVAPTCKAHPGQPDWPLPADWAALNRAVGGRLLQPAPAAAPCHRSHPAYNAAACSRAKDNWSSSQFHAHHPTSSLWTNVNGYSCEVIDLARPCTGNGFPVYVLNATDPEQIAVAVKWAADRNVRVNVKSTGHDFLGRSTQPYSLSIWVHYMQKREFHAKGFQPKGCPRAIPGTAISAGGGTQMERLVPFGRRFGVDIIAGSSNTVSVGGYISGGGHSRVSGLYGLAADAVLEMEYVTPSGEIVVANECQNTDLFWAARGGGGGTFGVMTRVTMQAFPALSRATWAGSISGPAGANSTWNAITAYHSAWARHLSPVGATGYSTGNVWKTGRLSVSVYLPGARNAAALSSLMAKVERETEAAGGRGVAMTGITTWAGAPAAGVARASTANDGPNLASMADRTFPGNGQNKIIASWLYGYAELTHPRLKAALMGGSDADSLMYQDFTGGPGCAKPPFLRGGGNAVGPGWRGALVRPAAEIQWRGDDVVKLAARKAAARGFTRSLASVGRGMGMYVNEADPDEEGVQGLFWGRNYPRLLGIKRKMDPRGVFWCKSCVGGEEWAVDRTGRLCRR